MANKAKSDLAAETWIRDVSGALAVGSAEGQPLPLAPDFAEVLSRVRAVLTVADIAEIVGVKERQVHHWAAGTHNPQGDARVRLLNLVQIVNNLETQLSPDQIKVWLWSPQPELAGVPIELLKRGKEMGVLSATKGLPLREELDDWYLVEIAKGGNASAYDALVRRYRGFARQKAEAYSEFGPSSDDLIQEGLVGLYKAIRDHQGGHHSDFGSFARHCITRQIIAAVRTDNDHRESDTGETSKANRELDAVLARFEELVADLGSRLPDFQGKVLSLYLDGHPRKRIADELEADVSEVEEALDAAKVRLSEVVSELDQGARH
ncbi:MAG TPA: sigma-70 family RNA polymerase sigma factor [Solirubrobacterales bacterium]|nr:sigma-70 family RNA polymerase sigma factor [Solirubrobacterales bacterium]